MDIFGKQFFSFIERLSSLSKLNVLVQLIRDLYLCPYREVSTSIVSFIRSVLYEGFCCIFQRQT